MANLFSTGIEIKSSDAESALKRVYGGFDNVASGAEKTARAMQNFDASANRASIGANALSTSLGQLGAQAATQALNVLVNTVSALAKNIFDAGTTTEKLKTQLSTLTGSKIAGGSAFDQIAKFAKETPFQLEEVANAYVKLANRGLDPTNEKLRKLGDLAASQGKSLNQVSEALLDATQGEFERLKEFGIRASKEGDKATLSFKGLTQTVENTPEAIEKAVLGFGTLRGVIGGMDEQSKTTLGKLSNISDSFFKISSNVADALNPAISASLDFISQMVDPLGENKNLFDSINASAQRFADYLAANPELAMQASKAIADGLGATMTGIANAAESIGGFFQKYPDAIDRTVTALGRVYKIMETLYGLSQNLVAPLTAPGNFVMRMLSNPGSQQSNLSPGELSAAARANVLPVPNIPIPSRGGRGGRALPPPPPNVPNAGKKSKSAIDYMALSASAAAALGIDPTYPLTIAQIEAAKNKDGSFNPQGMGGSGGKYYGLFQFGPNERRKYNIGPGSSRPNATPEEQFEAYARLTADRFRGVGMSTQGADLETLYLSHNQGNPRAPRNRADGFGNNAVNLAKRALAPGGDRDQAIRRYGGLRGIEYQRQAMDAANRQPDFDLAGYGGRPYADLMGEPSPVSTFDILKVGNDVSIEAATQAGIEKLKVAEELAKKEEERLKSVDAVLKGMRSQTDEMIKQQEEIANGGISKEFNDRARFINAAVGDLKLTTDEMDKINQLGDKYYNTLLDTNQLERQRAENADANNKAIDAYLAKLDESLSSLGALSAEQQKGIYYADMFGDSFDRVFDSIITGSGSATDALLGMLRSVASELASEALSPLKGLLKGTIAGLFGGGSSAPSFGTDSFSGGGIGGLIGSFFGGGSAGSGFTFPGLAEGGVITRPTLVAAGERGAEAIIPLNRMGGMGSVNTTITVNVSSDGSSQVSQQGGNNLGRQIEQAVTAVIQRQQRPGGLLYGNSQKNTPHVRGDACRLLSVNQ